MIQCLTLFAYTAARQAQSANELSRTPWLARSTNEEASLCSWHLLRFTDPAGHCVAGSPDCSQSFHGIGCALFARQPIPTPRFRILWSEPGTHMAVTVAAKRGTALRILRLVGRVACFNSANQINLLGIIDVCSRRSPKRDSSEGMPRRPSIPR
jgi:hypothetical protein